MCDAPCGNGFSFRRRICFGKLEEEKIPCVATDASGNELLCGL